jgi:hypothetical protein
MQFRTGCILFGLALPLMAASSGNGVEKMLTNEGLVVLARAGYNERFLVELIQAQPGRFDTSVEGLVYLAKQGISEKLVRVVMAAERREADRGEGEEPGKPPAAARTPVRMKMMTQKVLVPVTATPPPLGPNPVIVVEKRVFGDRYYALPGAQAPLVTPVATPRAPQSAPGAAQVAAFH